MASWLDVFSKGPENVEGAKIIGAAAERGLNKLAQITGNAPPEAQAHAAANPVFDQNIQPQGPPLSAAQPPDAPALVAAPAPVLAPVQIQQPLPTMATQTETVTTKAPKLTEDQKQAEADAYQARITADQAKANLDTDLALAQSMEAQDTVRKLAKQQKTDQAEAATIKAEADDAAKRWQGSIDEYNAIRKEGPEQLSTGGAVLAAIAQALGALGSGLTGGPNHAMAILNKAADDRVRKWERQLSEARGNIDAKQNAVSWFRQKGLDARASAAAARQAVLDEMTLRGDALVSQYKSDAIQKTWEQTKALRGQERAIALNQRSLEEQDKKVVRTMRAPTGGGGAQAIQVEGLQVDVPQADKDGNFSGYKTYQARSREDAEKIRQAFTVREQIKAGIDQLRTFMKGTLVHSAGPNNTEIETMADDLRTQFGVLRGLGALSSADYKIASQLGKPGSPFQLDSTTYKLMGKLEGRLDAAVLSELVGRGLMR